MFYFNTTEQIKGDEACNKGNYRLALSYYNQALANLNNAANQTAKSTEFYDAYTYLTSEIILTICDYLLKVLADSSIDHKAI